jgi:hypothetical protein
MNTILEGYFPDEVIAEQTGYTVRSIRRIRANSPDAPPHIRVKLQISEPDARRAIKVASISNEAKAAAREVGLNINRTALLEAAKQAEPKKQVETIRSRAKKPKSLLDRINPLDLAWDRSIKAQRREFVRKRWIELMRVHEEDHPAVAAYTELRRIKQAADRAEVRAAAHGDGLDIPAELRRPAS